MIVKESKNYSLNMKDKIAYIDDNGYQMDTFTVAGITDIIGVGKCYILEPASDLTEENLDDGVKEGSIDTYLALGFTKTYYVMTEEDWMNSDYQKI